MAIAGAVVIPSEKTDTNKLKERLSSLYGVEVQNGGDKGIQLVLKKVDIDRLNELSEVINGWNDVIDFQLAYFRRKDD
jgi:nitrate reductase NapAB chaperone NapD